jgi:hypothetical protein
MELPVDWRMLVKLGRILLCTALLVAAFGIGRYLGRTNITEVHAQQRVVIPRAYGVLRSTIPGDYVFEAPDGTIRIVDMQRGNVEAIAQRN